jgi:hypothetical protein
MTIQTLINDRAVQFSTSAELNPAPMTISNAVPLNNQTKLPYQPTHQVELLHLQAETEALLQEIQTAKQQRVSAMSL